MNEDEFVARYRKSDGLPQSLKEHLEGVAEFAEQFAVKIGLPIFGKLMGWNPDPGKYSAQLPGAPVLPGRARIDTGVTH